MNDNEKKYLEWLEKMKQERDNVIVTYSTTDGDTSSEEFFREANLMNEAEPVEVTDYSENFPQYDLLEPLVDMALQMAISKGRAKKLVFNDKTTKK